MSFFKKLRNGLLGLNHVVFSEKYRELNSVMSFLRNFKNSDFELCKPPQLVDTVKWKYDYIVFRKRTSNQS